MIDPLDIRLYNYLFDKDNKNVSRVLAIEQDRVRLEFSHSVWTTLDKIDGVLIADTWLKEYGFEHSCIVPSNERIYKKDNFKIFYSHEKWYIQVIGYTFKEIKYLHELQNSYKEITGKELKMI